MYLKRRLLFWFSLPLFINILMSFAGPSNPTNFGGNQKNETCMKCHIKTINESMPLLYKHEPFFKRQCDKCHIPPNSEWWNQDINQIVAQTGGYSFEQGQQLETRTVVKSTGENIDHLVSLKNLVMGANYKFRIVLRNVNTSQKDVKLVSKWENFIPDTITEACDNWAPLELDEVRIIYRSEAGSSQQATKNKIRSLSLCRLGNTLILISWQTDLPCEGWIEVEGLEQKKNLAVMSEKEKHPLMNDPEQISIDMCYSCHNAMGTSHPVRIYSGQKTQIPPDLPTVKNGMITCVTCHFPHSSANKQLIRQKITTKVCIACHFVFKGASKSTTFPDY